MQKFLNNFLYRSNLIVFLLFLLFLFFRLYRLPSTLQFWGDIGRDLYVVYQTTQTGKVPLLGPSISFLPLHQSPIYYYLYYPLFYLSGFSAYTTVMTGVWIFGIAWFLLIKFRSQLKLPAGGLVIIGLIVALHPEFVRQLRPPWNPSLAFPSLLASVLILRILIQKFSWKLSWLFHFGLALAIGLTYSVIPVAVTLWVILAWRYRRNWRLLSGLVGQLGSSLGVIFLPVIAFEIRYSFPMLRNLISVSLNSISVEISAWQKFDQLFSFVSGVYHYPQTWIATHFIWIVLILNCVLIARSSTKREKDRNFLQVLSWLAIGLGFTLLTPFEIHSHYIFGIMSVLLVCIVFLRLRFQIVLLTALILWWLHPIQTTAYFSPARRPVSQLEECAQLVCAQETNPIYVTMQAWHSSHFAGEHLFLWNKAGCLARDPIQVPNWSNRMAVIADNSTYIHGESDFHELTVFGESKEVKRYTCPAGIQVHILER